MYKHRYGHYKDFGEHKFEVWEKTDDYGAIPSANIASTLNNHFSGFGSWHTYRAKSTNDYLSHVAVDTYQYHQPVIVDIDTEKYGFWNGKALNHYDFDYGWDSTGSKRCIYVAEEWDPIFIYGRSSYGNPYGRHKAFANHAFKAENHTSYHTMVV